MYFALFFKKNTKIIINTENIVDLALLGGLVHITCGILHKPQFVEIVFLFQYFIKSMFMHCYFNHYSSITELVFIFAIFESFLSIKIRLLVQLDNKKAY